MQFALTPAGWRDTSDECKQFTTVGIQSTHGGGDVAQHQSRGNITGSTTTEEDSTANEESPAATFCCTVVVTRHLKDVKHLRVLNAVLQKSNHTEHSREKRGKRKSRAQEREEKKREEKRRVSRTLIRGRTDWEEGRRGKHFFFFKQSM